MDTTILTGNLNALKTNNPRLAEAIERTAADRTYTTVITAKNGYTVPCYSDGMPANSRYDPRTEAERTIGEIEENTFVFFLGITGAHHIRLFLNKFPGAHCAAAESSTPALKSLLSILPMDDILSNPRFHLLEDVSADTILRHIPGLYLPVLHGAFKTCSHRSWAEHFSGEAQYRAIEESLERVSRDFSVQAHFGKVWFSNFFRNIQAMEHRFVCGVPPADTGCTALIAAAGPSLDEQIPEIRKNRETYRIFSTDTAYSTLRESGIVPDYYVTIDPQYYSALHLYHPLDTRTTVIADCCANPAPVRQALSAGSAVILTAGNHPLAALASSFSPLPFLDTSCGTVTASARDAASSLGFGRIRTAGADFSYTNGKPYSRGTYLSSLFDGTAGRMKTAESGYVTLMFRTPVTRSTVHGKVSYSTETLRTYRLLFEQQADAGSWTTGSFSQFPADVFVRHFSQCLASHPHTGDDDGNAFTAMLPFFSWYQNRYGLPPGEKTQKKAIELALELIAGYTVSS